jgi:hypothetical protein
MAGNAAISAAAAAPISGGSDGLLSSALSSLFGRGVGTPTPDQDLPLTSVDSRPQAPPVPEVSATIPICDGSDAPVGASEDIERMSDRDVILPNKIILRPRELPTKLGRTLHLGPGLIQAPKPKLQRRHLPFFRRAPSPLSFRMNQPRLPRHLPPNAKRR